jgi:hypothetical protein
MKSYKINCNCNLILKYSESYFNNCIDDNLLKDLFNSKSLIDRIDINKWEKFKNYIINMNISILHQINHVIYLMLTPYLGHILKYMK